MDKKTLLCISTILLLVTINFAYGIGMQQNNPDDERHKIESSTDKYNDGGMDGYYNDDKKIIIGNDGIDPRKDGVDVGDFGPVYGKGVRPMSKSLNVWISLAEDWDTKYPGKYGGKPSKYGKNNKYNNNNKGYNNDDDKNNDYKNDDYKNDDYKNDDYKKNDYNGGKRGKRSYQKITFPVKQIKNYRKFPLSLFPPLISIAPWLPIFYDKLTYQTFIFSLQGGLIIIPPLINFYGQRFAVAQLIQWGYASLVSTGAPPPPALNVAPLVQPVGGGVVAGGAVAGGAGGGAAGGKPAAPAPTYNSKTYKFEGGLKTELPAFRPRPNYLQEGYNNNAAPAGSPKYSS